MSSLLAVSKDLETSRFLIDLISLLKNANEPCGEPTLLSCLMSLSEISGLR